MLHFSKTKELVYSDEVSSSYGFKQNLKFEIRDNELWFIYHVGGNIMGSDIYAKVADWYDEIDGQVFYTVPDSNGRVHLYKAEPNKEDALVLPEPVEKVETADGNFVCKLAAGGDYGIKVLDKSGSLRLAITDQASNVFVNHDFILFVSLEDKSIKRVHLEY